MLLVYLAGPIRAKTYNQRWENIVLAEQLSYDIWRMGFLVFCPHTNHNHLDGVLEDADILARDIEILQRCDLCVILPGWENSTGTNDEIKWCKAHNKPVYYMENDSDMKRLKELAHEQEDTDGGGSQG